MATSLSRANDSVTKERHVFHKRQLCSFAKQNMSATNDMFAKQTTAAMFKLQYAALKPERHFNFASYFAQRVHEKLVSQTTFRHRYA